MKYYLAIDIGASSGRHIVGWNDGGEIATREVYRFKNGNDTACGHLVWDAERLVREVREGIKAAFAEFPHIESLSIDTWGVDYVLMKDDVEVPTCYAYRDSRTEAVIDEVHSKVPFSELYAKTGCQFQTFNSVYQLYADLKAGRLEGATDFLMIPEYIMYKLTGVKRKEYTNATTTGLINAKTGKFDTDITDALGLPRCLFSELSMPGTEVGALLPEVAEYVGGQTKVVLCATHDTGSAVCGIPMIGNEMYISSGTWSLLGVKTDAPITTKKSELANYSNEGGVGYNRYQKNIMGMWLIQSLRRELCPDKDFDTIADEAAASEYDVTVDANASVFLAPESMAGAIYDAVDEKPRCDADYFRCAYRSLAMCYKNAIAELQANTGTRYEKLYIVGGGAKNKFLNALTAEMCGVEVLPIPIEATAIGNLKIQMKGENI